MKPDTLSEDFLKVIEDHKKIIFKVCNAYCKNPEDKKDLTQEITYQIWRSFEKYDDTFKYSTWIYRIALNVAISFYRSESKINLKSDSIDNDKIDIADTPQDEHLETNIKLLNGFIDKLDRLNKALMILYLDDKSHKEISEILGITETNVATKISRIKLKLKKQFENINN